MAAWLLIALVAIAYFLYQWSCRPKQRDDGSWRVVDHGDGPLRVVLALFALYVSTVFAIGFTAAPIKYFHQKPAEAAGMLVVVLLVYGWILWREGAKVVEALFAAPGEIHADDWPLACGELATITYVRRLRLGRPAGEINANVVRYTTTTYRSNGKTRTRRERSEVIPLKDGEAHYDGRTLEATWRFRVPQAMGDPRQALKASLVNLFFNRNVRSEWVLEVETPLTGMGKLDSRFALDLVYAPGRSELRLDAG